MKRIAIWRALALAVAMTGCVKAKGAEPPAPATFQVRFETTKGIFVVEAHREWAPNGVDRFYAMVKERILDNSRFFRVIAGSVAQFGVPGEPGLASRWRLNTIPDDSARASNTRGMLSFALSGKNSRTTQMFINLADNTKFDTQGFAPFARVIEGMDVVDKLFATYGERAAAAKNRAGQLILFEEGNPALDTGFPLLDQIIRVRFISARGS